MKMFRRFEILHMIFAQAVDCFVLPGIHFGQENISSPNHLPASLALVAE